MKKRRHQQRLSQATAWLCLMLFVLGGIDASRYVSMNPLRAMSHAAPCHEMKDEKREASALEKCCLNSVCTKCGVASYISEVEAHAFKKDVSPQPRESLMMTSLIVYSLERPPKASDGFA